MLVPKKKRFEYWNHFIARWVVDREGGGHGVTGPRLRKIRAAIMADDDFWQDIALRHGGLHNSPEHLREHRRADYDHCLGNFWGMIYQNITGEETNEQPFPYPAFDKQT